MFTVVVAGNAAVTVTVTEPLPVAVPCETRVKDTVEGEAVKVSDSVISDRGLGLSLTTWLNAEGSSKASGIRNTICRISRTSCIIFLVFRIFRPSTIRWGFGSYRCGLSRLFHSNVTQLHGDLC